MLSVKTYVTKNGIWFNDPLPESKYPLYYEEFCKNNTNIYNTFNGEDRIYGFVDIQYNNQTIIGNQYFGTIIDMWFVYFQLVEAYLKNGEGHEFFPDFYCDLVLRTNKNEGFTLLVGNESNDYELDPKVFCKEVIKAAKEFFETYYLVTNDTVFNKYIKESIQPLLDSLE